MKRSRGIISGHFIVLGTVLAVVALLIASLLSLRTEIHRMEEERQRVISQAEAKWLPRPYRRHLFFITVPVR